jgi:hypothetical protein
MIGMHRNAIKKSVNFKKHIQFHDCIINMFRFIPATRGVSTTIDIQTNNTVRDPNKCILLTWAFQKLILLQCLDQLPYNLQFRDPSCGE